MFEIEHRSEFNGSEKLITPRVRQTIEIEQSGLESKSIVPDGAVQKSL